MGERLNKILFGTYFLSWIGVIIFVIIDMYKIGGISFGWYYGGPYFPILLIIIALIGASFNIKSYNFILMKIIPPVIMTILFFLTPYRPDKEMVGMVGFSFIGIITGYFFFLLLVAFIANKYSIMKYGKGEKFLKEGKYLLFIIIISLILAVLFYVGL